MKKFLPFSRRQPSLDRFTVCKGGWAGADRFNVKSFRRTSASSLNIKSIQVVRGAYNIDLNKVDSSFTKLHKACLLNDDLQARKHINKVDNNSYDSSKRYPIHLATVNGNFAIIRLLIENGADPNVQDNEGHTPLIKSIECGHEHLVKYFLSNGADPNISDLENNTSLHWAIITESIIAIDALISSKKCNFLLKNNRDETCLHLAVRSPLINTLTFDLLVEAGSDLTAKDQLGLTAIDIAQACNNEVAMIAFQRHTQGQENGANTKRDSPQGELANLKRLCEEYRSKYLKKNSENLEYEKKVIQLSAQIERLKLDMSYIKDQNDKLEQNVQQLSTENAKLKAENQETTTRAKERNLQPPMDDNASDCRGHEEFLRTKASLQERINKLKSGLTT